MAELTTIYGSIFDLDYTDDLASGKCVNRVRKLITRLKLEVSESRRKDQELQGEQWRVIPQDDGSDSNYEVSNTGHVRHVDTHDLLDTRVNADGYKYVVGNGASLGFSTKMLHRLVAEAFVKNHRESYNVINHIDEDIHNNNAWNLEWTTVLGNLIHGTAIERAVLTRTDPQRARQLLDPFYKKLSDAKKISSEKSKAQQEKQRYERAQMKLFEANKNGISQMFMLDNFDNLSISEIADLNAKFEYEMREY